MIDAKINGPWSNKDIAKYLTKSVIPIRLSLVSPTGWPVVVSLWYQFQDGSLMCASRRTARIVKLIENNPRCGFEISSEAPPYSGVRGQGTAYLDEQRGEALLSQLVDRYVDPKASDFRNWLQKDAKNEIAIRIVPHRIMSWDYRQRMTKGLIDN
jgi:nitroimidazol reductase NimA-like FMN-containing flavoprotein (pyridoxamine 5'-phosphate oxidase superfamily)